MARKAGSLQCPDCPETFTRQNGLTRHQNHAHGGRTAAAERVLTRGPKTSARRAESVAASNGQPESLAERIAALKAEVVRGEAAARELVAVRKVLA